jgi:hypothetical protein
MDCRNHAGTPAMERCTGCAEPFCGDCLVEIHGQKYCGSCKVLALKGTPVIDSEPTIPCKEATEALICAIVGIFCFGIILGPVALFKASKARKLMAEDPRLAGAGKVTAATIIAVFVLIFWVIGIISRTAAVGRGS